MPGSEDHKASCAKWRHVGSQQPDAERCALRGSCSIFSSRCTIHTQSEQNGAILFMIKLELCRLKNKNENDDDDDDDDDDDEQPDETAVFCNSGFSV